jgi:TP901 family phage tail tape measure protein
VSNDFNASVVISTKESEAGIRQLDSAARDLDKTLQNLHKSLQTGQGDLDKVTKSMAELTRANAALIRSEQDRAKATVLAAKADGQMIVNQSKRQKSANDTALAEAKANKIRQQSLASGLSTAATSTRRDAEARVRMAATEAVTQARVASEMARGAVAQQNLATAAIRTASATDLAAARTARLADSSRKAASGTLELNDSLSNSRYLLYDVGQTYTVLAMALQAIPVATAAVAIAYERDFAQVVRTNDSLSQSSSGIATLREDLKSLATEIPLTFGEFANIATIGGQLGIAGQDVGAFTETVARFGAASNVSLDEASTAFGRLQNSYDPMRKDPDFFNKIGSAIAYVGVKSAATESEIIAVNNQISAAGATFGFAADEIVGMSGALASVRIRPELARGAFQRIMLGLSRAADEGGEAFNQFGKYTGLAADEAQALFKNDPSQFFYKYIGGIKAAIAETGSASAVLDDIGAKNVFDKQFILGLSQGYDVFTDSLANSNKAFNEGTFLNSSTEGVFNTVDAKLKRIANSIKNFTDTIGKGSLPGLDAVASSVLNIVNGMDRFAQATPGFTATINILLGLGSVVGILLAFKAAQAFVLAGLVGFQQVLGKGTLAAGLTAKGILQQVAVTMLMHKGITQASAQALVAQAGAFKAMGFAAQATNGQIHLANAGLLTTANTTARASTGFRGMASSIKSTGGAMLGLVGGPIGALIMAVGLLGFAWLDAKEQISGAADEMARAAQNGDAAALAGTAQALGNIKVTAADGVIALGSLNKKLIEVARDAGVPYEKLVKAAQQGENAGKAVNALLDEVARSKGFADAAAVLDSLDPKAVALAAQFGFLREKVSEVGSSSVTSAKNLDDVAKAGGNVGDATAAATPDVEGIGAAISEVGDDSLTAAEKLDQLIDGIFGMVDAAGNTQSALQGLGESLAESADFGPGTEGGRANVDAFRDTLKAAAQEQQWLIENTEKGVEQASADYIAFVEGLVAEMTARGVDPANVQIMAEQAKNIFGTTLLAGAPLEVPVQVSQGAAANAAVSARDQVQSFISSLPEPDVFIGANTSTATGKMMQLAQNLALITGYPYEVVMDALTNPAHEKSVEIYDLITSITNKTYTAPIGADTSAAITNVRNFASYASQQLAAVQSAYNSVAASAPTLAKYTKPLFKGVTGVTSNVPASIARPTMSAAPVAQIAAPAQVAPKLAPSAAPNFGSLNDGYNKVKNAAKGAGDAGKKAGEDMANGIDDAAQAADDYANRLKQGLTSAFDKQYGVQKATDDYHSALNAINKKREDELSQIDELISKQKELNDEVQEEVVNARKAQIEKDISLKYGEVDRAADYAQQEQEALNAADAKRKDIAANNAQIISLRAGIGELNGYSDAAIANRAALRDLESKMLDMVVAYANTGASVDQVRNYAAGLTRQFQIDVGQMGYNQWAVGQLQGSLERYIGVVNSVPYHKPTTVTADVGGPGHGAMGAVNGFNGAADWATRPRTAVIDVDARKLEDTMRRIDTQIRGGGFQDDPSMTAFQPGTFSRRSGGGPVPGFAGGGVIPGKAPSNLSVDNRFASVDGKGLIKVQSEEFIMQKRAVDFWGEDFMHAINSMKMPAFNTGGSLSGRGGGGSASGPLLVELTAENLQAILRLAERDINLFADTEQLASSVNEGQRILASKGVS